ncbi:MAG: cellulase family glycosylhydrolase [Planctomycetes bacterium]|nr:cellulase family glycosylhydrolase [Planctomycetota bacterium]
MRNFLIFTMLIGMIACEMDDMGPDTPIVETSKIRGAVIPVKGIDASHLDTAKAMGLNAVRLAIFADDYNNINFNTNWKNQYTYTPDIAKIKTIYEKSDLILSTGMKLIVDQHEKPFLLRWSTQLGGATSTANENSKKNFEFWDDSGFDEATGSLNNPKTQAIWDSDSACTYAIAYKLKSLSEKYKDKIWQACGNEYEGRDDYSGEQANYAMAELAMTKGSKTIRAANPSIGIIYSVPSNSRPKDALLWTIKYKDTKDFLKKEVEAGTLIFDLHCFEPVWDPDVSNQYTTWKNGGVLTAYDSIAHKPYMTKGKSDLEDLREKIASTIGVDKSKIVFWVTEVGCNFYVPSNWTYLTDIYKTFVNYPIFFNALFENKHFGCPTYNTPYDGQITKMKTLNSL